MGRIQSVLAFIAVLIGVSCAFNAAAYLYDGESTSMVTQTIITVQSGTYTLMTINGVDTFLLSESGEPLTDASSIASILTEHETSALMPSDAEWAAVKDKLLEFNRSRNYKTRFGPAEANCLQGTGLSFYPCETYATCMQTASLVCSLQPGSGCSPDLIATPILNYSLAVKALNTEMAAALKLHADLRADTASTTFSQMQIRITNIRSAATSIQKNILRFPESGDRCPEGGFQGCIGLCPSAHFATAALDNASGALNAFSARAAPLEGVSALATSIATATRERLDFAATSAQALEWAPRWKAFKSKYEPLRVSASSLVPFVADPVFTDNYAVFNTKWTEMDQKIAKRDFNSIAAAYVAAEAAAAALNTSTKNALLPYNNALNAQNAASDALVQARWKTSSKISSAVAAYNALASRKNALDAQFKPPLTSAKYSALAGNYSALALDAQKYMDSQAQVSDTVSQVGSQFGAASVNGVFSLAAAVTPLSYSTRSSLAPIIPPFVLFLTDLAVVSVAVVMFVGVLVYFKGLFHNKAVLGLWMLGFFAFLFALGVGSIAIFAFVNSAASSGSFDEFLPNVMSSQASYVAIDQAGATPSQIASMSSCANFITAQVRKQFNKSAEIFTYSGKDCKWLGKNTTANTANGTMTREQCFDKAVGSPIFALHAGTPIDPKFSSVYVKQVDITGNEATFTRCEVGDVLG